MLDRPPLPSPSASPFDRARYKTVVTYLLLYRVVDPMTITPEPLVRCEYMWFRMTCCGRGKESMGVDLEPPAASRLLAADALTPSEFVGTFNSESWSCGGTLGGSFMKSSLDGIGFWYELVGDGGGSNVAIPDKSSAMYSCTSSTLFMFP